MKLLVLVSLLLAAEAAHFQSYILPSAAISSSTHDEITSSSKTLSDSFSAQGGLSLGQEQVLFSQGELSLEQGEASFNQGGLSLRQKQASFIQGSFSSEQEQASFNQGGLFLGQGGGTAFSLSHNNFGIGSGSSLCHNGEVRHVDGSCITPEVTRNYYAYTVPEQPKTSGPLPPIPPPKVEQNILFVKLPEEADGEDPIIVPPPRQNNVVYILKKMSGPDGQKVIEVPEPTKTNPEVYFVDYNPDENPTLPGGIDLQTALSSAAQGTGQVITGSSSIGSGPFGTVATVDGVADVDSGVFESGSVRSGFETGNQRTNGFDLKTLNAEHVGLSMGGFEVGDSSLSNFGSSVSISGLSNTGTNLPEADESNVVSLGGFLVDSMTLYRTP